ncbi:hypothetical protein IP88_14100 [alpha proteobacterium AAP81b]|nr:hypothetical protein IP88_14100 [alpha proteobacterium AAP81b]
MSATATTASRWAFPALLLGNLALSFGPLLVRLADVAPVASAFWRMALGFPAVLLLALLTGIRRAPAASAWRWGALAGLFFAADLALWHLGIVRTSLANASLVSNAASFLLPLWGIVVLHQRPTRLAQGAIALAFVGTALLMGGSAEVSARHLVGDLLCFAAAILYTAYILVVDRLRGTLPPFPILALATGFGALALLPVAPFLSGGSFWPGDWTPLLLLALGSQVIGQGLIVFSVGHLPPLVVGLAFLTQPAISAAIGYARFGEVPGPWQAAGAALVAVALVLVRLPERRRMPPAARA